MRELDPTKRWLSCQWTVYATPLMTLTTAWDLGLSIRVSMCEHVDWWLAPREKFRCPILFLILYLRRCSVPIVMIYCIFPFFVQPFLSFFFSTTILAFLYTSHFLLNTLSLFKFFLFCGIEFPFYLCIVSFFIMLRAVGTGEPRKSGKWQKRVLWGIWGKFGKKRWMARKKNMYIYI